MRGNLLKIGSWFFLFFAATLAWSENYDLFEVDGSRISIAEYNIENFMDNVHTDGKDDYSFLPKSFKDSHPDLMKQVCMPLTNYYYRKECFDLDWSDEVVQQKIQNIGQSIHAMNNGRGPDIIVMEEVKNVSMLTRLRDQALSDLGYQSIVLIPGPDKRGINVGMLSKFPVVDAQLHIVDLDNPTPKVVAVSLDEAQSMETTTHSTTRGILEATFKIGDHLLTVFGNHWPSQAAPTESRARAAWTLYQAASQAYDRGRSVVALGDFNLIEGESPNPIQQYLQNPSNPLQFMDVREEFLKRYGRDRIAPGTHFYDGKWNCLDKFLVLKQSFGDREEGEWAKFHVHAPSFLLQDERVGMELPNLLDLESFPAGKIPMRFNAVTRTGYSDHLGIVGSLLL